MVARGEAAVVRLGFACRWLDPPEATWSHTPWHLRSALQERCDLVDLPAQRGRLAGAVLHRAQVAGLTRGTPWWFTRTHDALTWRRVRHQARRLRPEAVLQVGDLTVTREPFWVYQDLSYDALRRWAGRVPGGTATSEMPPHALERRARRQRRVYARAAGVFAMSRWFADQLVADGCVVPERVHVVHAGANAMPTGPVTARRPDQARPRLLFVGRDFVRKGGDLVLAAHAALRAGGVDARLTVAGPARWPQPGEPPAGVRFAGPVDTAAVGRLMDEHDVFVLPSRFEPFGIAFVEAAARGLPVVGPDAFAVPEIVEPGVHGALVAGEDAALLADAVARVVADDALHDQCAAAAEGVRLRFSWAAVAGRMLDVIGAERGRTA